MTNYAGIDYSLGQSNVDKANGIHYGVVSINSLNLDCVYDGSFDEDYGEATCRECGNKAIKSSDMPAEFEDADWNEGKDYACLECERTFWSDEAFSEEMLGMSYDKDGYKLESAFDNTELFITASPYYTFAQFCSPCAPGAGNIDNPCADGPKTYCLDHDWFEDSKAPYKVYRVADDTEVLPDSEDTASQA